MHINKSIEFGILEEKIYGWWFFDDVDKIQKTILPSGIPISPDIIYYISASEALNLIEILKNLINY